MDKKLKTPKPNGSERLKELYQEILERPFSPELGEVLRKKPGSPMTQEKRRSPKVQVNRSLDERACGSRVVFDSAKLF